MKITAVEANNRKKAFELRTGRETLDYPYAKLALRSTPANPVVNEDPCLNELLVHHLTMEARKAMEQSDLAKREVPGAWRRRQARAPV